MRSLTLWSAFLVFQIRRGRRSVARRWVSLLPLDLEKAQDKAIGARRSDTPCPIHEAKMKMPEKIHSGVHQKMMLY
jgi:hypothetical protein